MALEVDGVVIGSGPNGLVCAAYLAKAGLRVAVVERNEVAGGGCSTAELTLPGFRHNVHSNFHAIGAGPVTHDFELERFGLRYVYPPVQHAFVFSDATAICFHADPQQTAASIARFSPRDAARYLEVHRQFGSGQMGLFLRRLLFTPPLDDAALAERLPGGDLAREFLAFKSLSLYQAVDRTFEHDRVRTAFKLHCHGSAYEDAPGTGHFVLRIVARSGWSGLAVGGADALAKALIGVIEAHGGTVVTSNEVTEIDVTSGRATGVRLADGTTVRARRFVTSSLDPGATLRLAGDSAFPADVVGDVARFRWAAWSLATLHLALLEPPRYRAADWDPAVNDAYGVYLGADSTADLQANFEAIARGELPPRFIGNGACNTLFDPSQAPAGRHTAFWWPFAPFDLGGAGPAAWDARRDEIAAEILRQWTAYAPNLGQGVVLGRALVTPLDIVRHIPNMVRGSHHGGAYVPGQIDASRPTPALAQYRTPVEGLYLCGATSHPGGSINGGPGYNAANAIAADLGIERWWTPVALSVAEPAG